MADAESNGRSARKDGRDLCHGEEAPRQELWIQPAGLTALAAALLVPRMAGWPWRVLGLLLLGLAIVWRPNEASSIVLIVASASLCRPKPDARLWLAVVAITGVALTLAVTLGRNDLADLWLANDPLGTSLLNSFDLINGAPWSGVGIGALSAAWLLRGRTVGREALLVLLATAIVWVSLASFNDFAARHTLSLRGFLAASLASSVAVNFAQLPRARQALLATACLVLLAVLGSDALEAAEAWYRPLDGFPPTVGPVLQELPEDLWTGGPPCLVVVTGAVQFGEDWKPALEGRFEEHPPLSLLAAGALEEHQQRGVTCFLWAEPAGAPAWDDRGLKSQADRLARRFEWRQIHSSDIGGAPAVIRQAHTVRGELVSRHGGVLLRRWLFPRSRIGADEGERVLAPGGGWEP